MNLVFFDRTAAPLAPTGQPVLTVRRDGNFLLAAAAVARYDLHAQKWVRLAQDTATGAWFLVFGAGPHEAHPFMLRVSKGKGAQARCFSTAATAKLVCTAFGLASDVKTLRLQVGAPLPHDAGQLYPLQLEGAVVPVSQALPVEAPVAAEPVTLVPDSMTIAPETAAPVEQEAPTSGKRNLWRTEEVDYLKKHFPTTALAELEKHFGRTQAAIVFKASTLKLKKSAPVAPEASAVVPAPTPKPAPAPVVVATPGPVIEPVREDTSAPARKTFSLQARAEELTAFWYEREMSLATPTELGEIRNLLSHYPRDKRSFEMGVVLDRAEKEHTERLKSAGKGGNRG